MFEQVFDIDPQTHTKDTNIHCLYRMSNFLIRINVKHFIFYHLLKKEKFSKNKNTIENQEKPNVNQQF